MRDQPEISHTELEFETATKAELPRLVFLLDDQAADLGIPPARLFDQDARCREQQRAFRRRLCEAGVTVLKVAGPDQLEVALFQALNETPPSAQVTAGKAETAPGGEAALEQELMADYLEALVEEIRHLRPGRIRKFNLPLELVLDDIYIELDAARERPDVDRRVTLEELAEAMRQAENWNWQNERDREQQLKLYAELDRSFREHDAAGEPESLITIVERHREVVILGDPGSGKTTLLKHLALKAVQAILGEPDGAELGTNRVPLYIRISEYAESRARTSPDLGLGDYLARYVAGLQLPNADQVAGLLRRLLDEGRCFMLLDGLDEVIDDGDRVNVANAIAQFAAVFRDKSTDIGAPGNSFVVTSRIAGYRPFINLPRSFSEYTIRPMRSKQIERFLERWCQAVERQLEDGTDPAQVEENARREQELILAAISHSPGVRRLSENPLLLRILAMLHRSTGHLPQRRVQVYEEAADMLLHDWHLERGSPKGAEIDTVLALKLLGPVAMEIHTRWPSGFMSLGETEKLLCRLRGRELGDPPEQFSIETVREVRKFLKRVREHSGLFVERGNGLYGFMHLTFQEYFVARHLVSVRDKARDEITARLHQPRWREPILLAVCAAASPFTNDIEEYITAILDARSEHEAVLHRDLLFAAECVGDSVGVPELLRRVIARRLITLYSESRRAGRYALLRRQVRDALRILYSSADSWVVEAALADVLMRCYDAAADLSRVLELVELLQAGTQPVADALRNIPNLHLLPDVRRILHRVEARIHAETEFEARVASPPRWNSYRNDLVLARAVGAVWLYGWRDLIELGLGVSDEMLRGPDDGHDSANAWTVLTRLRQLSWQLELCDAGPRTNPAAVAAELDAISRTLIADFPEEDDDRGWHATGGWHAAGGYLAQIRGWYEELSASTPQSNRLLAYFLDGLTLASATHFDGENPEMVKQIIAELLSGLFALARGRQFTSGPKRRFRVKAGRLVSQAEMVNLQAQLFTLVSAPSSDPGAEETFRQQLATVLRRLEGMLGTEIQPELERWGRAVLQQAQFTDALAPTMAGAIRQAMPLLPANDADGWRAIAAVAGTAVTEVAARLLRTGHNPQQYSEAAFLLARADGQGLESVLADLDADQPERCRLALLALGDPAVRYRLDHDDEVGNRLQTRLIELADRHPDLAAAVLDVLFKFDISPELLAWCWARLRQGDPTQARLIGEHLDAVHRVEGTTAFLDLVDDGLSGDATRPYARKLLDRLTWSGTKTYARYLVWLSGGNPEQRHHAALHLAQGDTLLRVPQDVLREATRSQLEAMLHPMRVSWAALRDDPTVMRLLTALWAHGWRDALALTWVEREVQPSREVPDIQDGEQVVRHFLEHARFGQALIPLVTRTAAELAGLERARAVRLAQPHHADVELIKQRLLTQLGTLAYEAPHDQYSPASLPLQLDAAILLAALRGMRPPWPRSILPIESSADLRRILEEGTDEEWFWAAGRMAGLPLELPVLRDALLAALDAGPRRHALALLLLCAEPALREAMQETLAGRLQHRDLEEQETLIIAGLLAADSRQAQLPASREHDAGASVAEFADEMLAAEPRTRAAAALGLLSHDLYARLLPALVEVALAGSDRLRWSGGFWLGQVCNRLRTDGSTSAVGWLYRYAHETSRGQVIEGTGHAGTVLKGATSAVVHTAPYWVLTWLKAIEHGSEAERQAAITALDNVSQASDEVVGCLCAKLVDASCDAVREAAASSLNELQRYSGSLRRDAILTSALVTALRDPTPRVRRVAAHALQWTEHETAATGAALLRLAQDDADVQARIMALLSLGRVLRHEAELHSDDIPDNPLLTQMQDLMAAPDPLISRAAAAGVAAVIQVRRDSMAALSAILPHPHEVLAATLSGVADTDYWDDQPDSRHQVIVGKLAAWLYERPAGERNQLVEWMLVELEMAAAGMESAVDDDQLGDPRWTRRRIIIAVLAELSDRLTHHSFAPTRQLDEVVVLFARTARDPDSFNSRRFSLRVLGNLQQFTPEVATAFFEACRDVSKVYQEPKAIIRKFKKFAPGCFRKLTAELFDPANDALLAAHAATLLGELGVSRSEELGPAGRREISAELVRFLRSTLAERDVIEQTQAKGGGILAVSAIGPLYDSVYEALVRVVAGPDAPAPVAGDVAPTAEVIWQQQRDGSSEQFQEILHRFEQDGIPVEGEVSGPKIKVFWREGHGEDYRVSVYGEQQWSQQIFHRIEGGYLQLIFQPGQGTLPFLDGVIIISQGAGLAGPGEPGADPRAVVDEPGAQLLHEIQLGSDDFIIGIPRSTAGGVSYIDHPDRRDLIVKAVGAAPLAPGDLVFRRSNDLNVSFPYWEGGIDKVSYTIEDDRLNIIVIPGQEGLKLQAADVVFSRGAGFPVMAEADVERVRRREGVRDMLFTVSLPWKDQEAGTIHYELTGNSLHIIVHPVGDWSFDPDGVRFKAVTLQDLVQAQQDLGRASETFRAGTETIQLLKAPPEISPHSLATALVFAGRTQIQSDPRQAVSLLAEARQLVAPEGAAELDERVVVLDLLAEAYRALGREDKAEEAAAEGRVILASAGEDILAGQDVAALLGLGQILAERGDLAQAMTALERAKTVLHAQPPAEATAGKRALASAIDTLGRAHEQRRAYSQALAAYQQALELTDAQADPRSYGVILHDIADIHRAQGHVEDAARLYRQAADHKQRGNASPGDLAITVWALGLAYEQLGGRGAEDAHPRALAAYQQALELTDARADPRFYGMIMRGIADIHRARGEVEDAAPIYRQAIGHMRRGEVSPGEIAAVLLNLAQVHQDFGRSGEALRAGTEAVEILKISARAEPHALAEALVFTARLRVYSEPGQALPLLEEAHHLLVAEGVAKPAERVAVLDLLARAYRALGREDEAQEALAAADSLLATLPTSFNISWPWSDDENSIASFSNEIRYSRLYIVLEPGAKGLRFNRRLVRFTEGPSHQDPDIRQRQQPQRRRRRDRRPLVISLPWLENSIEQVSYVINDNVFTLMLIPNSPGTRFRPGDVEFSRELPPDSAAVADAILAASAGILAGKDVAALVDLGQILIERGELERAGIALDRVKAVLQARLSAEAATAEHALSGIMDSLGRAHERRRAYPEALAAYGEALELADAAADPEFYGVILHDIADVHLEQGDLEQAARIYGQVISLLDEVRRLLTPEDSADRAKRVNVLDLLAKAYRAVGRKDKALEVSTEGIYLSRALIADQLRESGADDADILATRDLLCRLTGKSGDAAGAVILYQELLVEQIRLLGSDHPDILFTRDSLAFWTGCSGDSSGAVRLFRELLRDRSRTLGPDDPKTLATRGDLARWTAEAGDEVSAVRLFSELLNDRLRLMGHDYLKAAAETFTAFWSGETGDAAGVVRWLNDLLADFERSRGNDHSSIDLVRSMLAQFKQLLGRAGLPEGARHICRNGSRQHEPRCARVWKPSDKPSDNGARQ